jgi:hypothetical protein
MKPLFFVKQEFFSSGKDVASGSLGDAAPEKRWCRYVLQQGADCIVLGCTDVPCTMDADDAFPPFHAANFDEEDRIALGEAIHDGAVLIAETNVEPRCLLAYRIDDPHYWYGREATLKYLGVYNFRHAC